MTMDISLFLRGLLLAFTIAAPVGPVGVICMQRTLSAGRLNGFLSGLGASTAHALFASIAAFGLTFISNVLAQQQFWLRLIGGLLSVILGSGLFARLPKSNPIAGKLKPCRRLPIHVRPDPLNPITGLYFVAVFPSFGGIGSTADIASAISVVLGVFAGSTLWWLMLSIASASLERDWVKNTCGGSIGSREWPSFFSACSCC